MAHLLVTSMLRVTGSLGLRSMTHLLPQQASRLVGPRLPLGTTATTAGLGRTATFDNLRWLSSSAANLSDIRQQMDDRLDELFKDFNISPVFLQPALPSTPAKDVSEATAFMDQLKKHHAAIIEVNTVQHPLISVTHEELVQPILKASKKSPGRGKAAIFATRGSGTGKTRALVECQLALMQHKDKNILPFAITFNGHTSINKMKEGLNLHAHPHMAYAIMVCSRVLSIFHAEEGLQVARTNLLEVIDSLGTIRDYQVAAKHLYRATLAHAVRRMRQARPERPVDTVVLLVDETYMAHEAIGGNGTTLDYSANLRQALLDDEFFLDMTEKVDVALCISSLVPLSFETLSSRAFVPLPLASRLSASDVVAKWWLPSMLGKQEEDVQRWIASPENELNVKRLQVLAETMAPVPRHLEFALEHLTEHCVDQGGTVQIDFDSFRQVMAGVFESVKARYHSAELPLDVLRAAIYQEEICPVLKPSASNQRGIEMTQYDIARCIASSLIVNNKALASHMEFVPEVSLLMASYCMQDEARLDRVTPEVAEALKALGKDFLQLPITRSGDSLESCTAWMLQLRLLLLPSKDGLLRRSSLKELFRQAERSKALPNVKFALDDVSIMRADLQDEGEGDATSVCDPQCEDSPPAEAQLPHSQDQRGRFFKALNQSFLAPGETKLWPNVAKYEHFDHLLALNMVVEETDGEAGHEQTQTSRLCKPFLVFIDDASTHPMNRSQKNKPHQSHATYVTERLLREAKKRKAPAKDSLLEAFVEGRFCYVYHHTAKVLPQTQHDNVYSLDYKASQRFLGPMAPIYESMRVADAAANRQAGTT